MKKRLIMKIQIRHHGLTPQFPAAGLARPLGLLALSLAAAVAQSPGSGQLADSISNQPAGLPGLGRHVLLPSGEAGTAPTAATRTATFPEDSGRRSGGINPASPDQLNC